MTQFIESLRRLLQNNKIDKSVIEKMKCITDEERKYIMADKETPET